MHTVWVASGGAIDLEQVLGIRPGSLEGEAYDRQVRLRMSKATGGFSCRPLVDLDFTSSLKESELLMALSSTDLNSLLTASACNSKAKH